MSGGAGNGAIWNLTSTNGTYNITIDPNETGVTGYSPYDIIKIAGTDLGGSTPDHDAQITINSANSVGFPTGFSVAGVGADAVNNYIGPAWSTPQSGVGAAFNVTQTGTNYAVTVTQIGSGFAPVSYTHLTLPTKA